MLAFLGLLLTAPFVRQLSSVGDINGCGGNTTTMRNCERPWPFTYIQRPENSDNSMQNGYILLELAALTSYFCSVISF